MSSIWDSHDTVRKIALEVARTAHEGLGSTEFQNLRMMFKQELEEAASDPEIQLRAVVKLLIAETRKDLQPKTDFDVQVAGLCFMWLVDTHVAEWSLLELYDWGLSL